MTFLAPTLQAFFTERLITQQNASAHTVASYRDCLRLLVCFARTATGTQPAQLRVEQVDAAWSARSWTTSSTTAAWASPPATPGWRPCTRCSGSRRCASPTTPS